MRSRRWVGILAATAIVGAVVGACQSSREHVSRCLNFRTGAPCPTGSEADKLLRGYYQPPVYTDVTIDTDHPVHRVAVTAGVAEDECCYAVDYTVHP